MVKRYETGSKIREWSDLHFIAFELQMRRMEDEILWYRKEKLAGLTPSSFSYYLYEKKTEKMRSEWELFYEYQNIRQWTALENLIQNRIFELLKQDKITVGDYPENAEIIQMKKQHENFCIGWLLCFYFNAPIPEESQTNHTDFELEINRYGGIFFCY